MPIESAEAASVLDHAHDLIIRGSLIDSMNHLIPGLRRIRAACSADEWEQVCTIQSPAHRITALIHQDPFTRHAFEKPRGYPGDPDLLDYIFGDRLPPPQTTELGAAIFKLTLDGNAPRSVRARRDLLANAIDETAAEFAEPRVVSIVCGHLREAARSKLRALHDPNWGGEFIALDQDPRALEEVKRIFPGRCVRTLQAPLRGLICGKATFPVAHLIYAAGLYDYLPDRMAVRLTRSLFDMLAPGGRLMLANYDPRFPDIAYVEAFMGWRLVYRSAEQLRALAADIPAERIGRLRTFSEEHGNIGFLELTKA